MGIITVPSEMKESMKRFAEMIANSPGGRNHRSGYGKTSKRPPKLSASASTMFTDIQQHQKRVADSWIQIGWQLWGLEGKLSDADYGSVLKSLHISRKEADELTGRAYMKMQYPGERDEIVKRFREVVKQSKNKSRITQKI